MADQTPPVACEMCGITFALRASTGPCLKCQKLSSMERHSSTYEDTIKWPQCAMCGVTFQFMSPAAPGCIQICHSSKCIGKAGSISSDRPMGNDGTSYTGGSQRTHSTAISDATLARIDATHSRLGLVSSGSRGESGTSHTTESLRRHQHGGGSPGERQIQIGWEVRQSSNKSGIPNVTLGGQVRAYAESIFLEDIKAEFLAIVNISWLKYHPHSLVSSDVDWKWPGQNNNLRNVDPEAVSMKIGSFFDYYNKPNESNACVNSLNIPSHWKTIRKSKPSGSWVFLVFYIAFELYAARVEAFSDASPSSSLSSRSKRQRKDSTLPPPSNKLPKTSVRSAFPSSEFARNINRRSAATVVESTILEFKKLLCVTTKDGEVSIMNTKQSFSGLLADKHFAQGKMKAAFNLHITSGNDTGDFVAKRFYRVSSDDTSSITAYIEDLTEHRNLLTQEAIRMTQGTWILKEFYKHAATFPDVTVDHNIQFSLVFLAEERGEGVPSTASAVLDRNATPLWLVEPRRAMAVTKFTGTLDHSSIRTDTLAQTVYAFAHFSYIFSEGELVFADIQGTSSHENGATVMVLFDIMTHTMNADSGIGDHGEDGIQSFLKTHTCGAICSGLDIEGRSLEDFRSKDKAKDKTNDSSESDGSEDHD